MFSGNKPDCVTCGYVIALPENYEVIEMINLYGHCFVDSNGFVIISAIELALKLNNIEPTEANVYKIVVYLSVAISKQFEELKNGTKN